MGTLDSAQKRLEEARKAARSRATRERIGLDWPRADGIELAEALEEITFQLLAHGARVSLGNTEGTADIWCRMSFPTESGSQWSGMVAFMSSGTVEGAVRKMAQCTTGDPGHGVWRADRFARQ